MRKIVEGKKKCKQFTITNINNHARITRGRTLSIVSMSLEKRFITRPIGVVSNNSIGHRITDTINTKCISVDEEIQPKDIKRCATKFVIAIK